MWTGAATAAAVVVAAAASAASCSALDLSTLFSCFCLLVGG